MIKLGFGALLFLDHLSAPGVAGSMLAAEDNEREDLRPAGPGFW